MAASGSESTTAKQKLIDTREQALVELAGLGPNHPGRPALQAEIAETNRGLQRSLDQSSL